MQHNTYIARVILESVKQKLRGDNLQLYILRKGDAFKENNTVANDKHSVDQNFFF